MKKVYEVLVRRTSEFRLYIQAETKEAAKDRATVLVQVADEALAESEHVEPLWAVPAARANPLAQAGGAEDADTVSDSEARERVRLKHELRALGVAFRNEESTESLMGHLAIVKRGRS